MDCCGSTEKKVKTGLGLETLFSNFPKLKMFEEILKYKTSWSYSNDKVGVSYSLRAQIDRKETGGMRPM